MSRTQRSLQMNHTNPTPPCCNRERMQTWNENRSKKNSLWTFIKSWAFFGHHEDVNISADPRSDEVSCFVQPNPIEEEVSNVLEQDDEDTCRMPGAFGGSSNSLRTPSLSPSDSPIASLVAATEITRKSAATTANALDHPYQGTVITSVPPGETFDMIIPQTFGLVVASDSQEPVHKSNDAKLDEKVDEPPSTSGTQQGRSGGIASESYNTFELALTPEERGEFEEHLVSLAAWVELGRWKGLKDPWYPESEEVHSAELRVWEGWGELEHRRGIKNPWRPDKGYTPAESMINPYDKLNIFKRSIPGRKLSMTGPKPLLPEDVYHTKDPNNCGIRLGGSFNFALFHKGGCNGPETPVSGTLSNGRTAVGLSDKEILFESSLSLNAEPTLERPFSGDWITSGTTKDEQGYKATAKRKATDFDTEDNDAPLDTPSRGPPMKRRRQNPPDLNKANSKNAVHIDIGLPLEADLEQSIDEEWECNVGEGVATGWVQEGQGAGLQQDNDEAVEEKEDEEMIDETPNLPRAPLARRKSSGNPSRVSIRRVREVKAATGPWHKPGVPSPLRTSVIFDNPEEGAPEIPKAVPQRKKMLDSSAARKSKRVNARAQPYVLPAETRSSRYRACAGDV